MEDDLNKKMKWKTTKNKLFSRFLLNLGANLSWGRLSSDFLPFLVHKTYNVNIVHQVHHNLLSISPGSGVNVLPEEFLKKMADFVRVSEEQNACACHGSKFGRNSHNKT